MKYKVRFSGEYFYDIWVNATNEDEAIDIAICEEDDCPSDANKYDFKLCDVSVTKVKEESSNETISTTDVSLMKFLLKNKIQPNGMYITQKDVVVFMYTKSEIDLLYGEYVAKKQNEI